MMPPIILNEAILQCIATQQKLEERLTNVEKSIKEISETSQEMYSDIKRILKFANIPPKGTF